MVNFHEYIRITGNATELEDVKRNPYTWRHGQDGKKAVWEVMAQYPKRLEIFPLGMAGDDTIPIVGYYDFSKLKTSEDNRVELVDVRGGHGHILKETLEAHPDLTPTRMVLQDSPEVIALVEASNLLPDGVVKMAHDFHTEQPVKGRSWPSSLLQADHWPQFPGARAYYLRHVLHGYSDSVDVLILSQLAKAMKPDSIVLIADMVMSARVGEADFPAATLNNIVMAMGGKERTEVGFREILSKAGLELVKVWRATAGAAALVEAKLKNWQRKDLWFVMMKLNALRPEATGKEHNEADTATSAPCHLDHANISPGG
jgi:hypothetical protein